MTGIEKPKKQITIDGHHYIRYGWNTEKDTAYSAARKIRKEGFRARVVHTHGAYWVYKGGKRE